MIDRKNHSVRGLLQRHSGLITLSVCALLAVSIACTGESQSPPPPFKVNSDVSQLMHDVVYPSAFVVWKSVGTIMTEEGTEEIRPRSDVEWEEVHSGARTLMEAGNLLMMEGRAKDNDKWMERCLELIDAAATVLASAEAYDADAVFDQGELIYNSCENCHWDYRYEDDPNIIRSGSPR